MTESIPERQGMPHHRLLFSTEKRLLQEMRAYPGFPFTKDRQYLSLEQTMRNFKKQAFDHAKENASRSLLFVTGLPGVGKTETVNTILAPFVKTVAAQINQKFPHLTPPASVHIAREIDYEEAFKKEFVGPGKKYATLDTSKPYPPDLLYDLYHFMDIGVAKLLKANPNLFMVMDRPGGTTFALPYGGRWTTREYGLIPGDIAQGADPYTGIPLDVTVVGIIGGPNMLPRVDIRDRLVRIPDTWPLDRQWQQANSIREQFHLSPFSSPEAFAAAKNGAPKETVNYVHHRQWALVTSLLDTQNGREILKKSVPEFILAYLTYLSTLRVQQSKNTMPPVTEQYLTKSKEGKILAAEINEVAKKEGKDFGDIFMYLCYDFAGAKILEYCLGLYDPNVPLLGTIIYNDPPLPGNQ